MSPLRLYIKRPDTQAAVFCGVYDNVVEASSGETVCRGKVSTDLGASFSFADTYKICADGIMLDRKVEVLETSEELGFATAFSLGMIESQDLADYRYFAPGFWYDHNQYATDDTMGKIMDSEYYWFFETHLGLPVFTMYHEDTSECISFSRARADVILRSTGMHSGDSGKVLTAEL